MPAAEFSFKRYKTGEVVIFHHGKRATTLRGAAAADFLAQLASADADAAQALMARVTGNYKRGNERLAARHPRNK